MRLFVGIPVPEGSDFGEVLASLGQIPNARPVRPESCHITLRFLGEVDSAEPVIDALRGALRDAKSMPCVIEGLGTFPMRFPPHAKSRVIWAGVRADLLESLAARINDTTHAMGEPVEERRFVGHVTLARFSRATDVRKLVARHASTLFGQGILREVVLYRSPAHGEPGGYERVATFPLKAATS